MKKQYKNKITGDIAIENKTFPNYYFLNPDNIHKRFIENSCDWEEIVEKDYEILSFKDTYFNTYWKKGSNGKFGETDLYWAFEADFIAPDKFIIHSVKRLSTGEVFTIGDKVEHITTGYKQTLVKIYPNFEVDTNREHIGIAWLKPVKKPLFITEDGVEMFEGDKVWFITKKLEGLNLIWCMCKNDAPDANYLYFSSEAKAKEYIEMNKPVLSISEMLDFLEGNPKLGCNANWAYNKTTAFVVNQLKQYIYNKNK